jgi:hypothetical protein
MALPLSTKRAHAGAIFSKVLSASDKNIYRCNHIQTRVKLFLIPVKKK